MAETHEKIKERFRKGGRALVWKDLEAGAGMKRAYQIRDTLLWYFREDESHIQFLERLFFLAYSDTVPPMVSLAALKVIMECHDGPMGRKLEIDMKPAARTKLLGRASELEKAVEVEATPDDPGS